MSDAGIYAYDKVHQNTERRGIAEIGKRIPGMKDACAVQQRALRVGHLFLQAYEFEARIEQPSEPLQLDASALARKRISLPDYANSESGFSAESIPPQCDFVFIGRDVARAGYTPDIRLERERETHDGRVQIKLGDHRVVIDNPDVGIEAPH